MKKSPFGVRSIGLLLVCLLAGGSLLTAAEEIKSDPVFLPVIEKEQTEETEPAEVPAQEPDKAPVTEPIQVDKLEITASAAEPLPGETVKITVKITAKNQENSKLSPFIITIAAANGNAATKQFEEATVKNGEVWYEGGVLSYIYECTPLTEETTFTTVKAVVADAEKRYNEFASAQLTFGESPVEEPVTEEPAVEEPAVEEPAVEEPAVEEPAVEEPAVEEPAVEEPAVEEPAAEEPAVEEPVVEEPTVEEPTVEEPAVEEPVAEEPVAEEETPASKPEVVLSMKTDKDPAKLNDGDELTLIAGVEGLENGTYSLRWQILENGNWSDIAGADGPEYKVIYSEAMKGCAFRFIVTENEVPAEEAPAEPEA